MIGRSMNRQQFHKIIKQLPKLDPAQKQKLSLALAKQQNPILDQLAKECLSHAKCIHCDSERLRKYGKSNGRQRFYCNNCKKTFVCTRGSAYFYQHKADNWQVYLEHMLNRDSIRVCAKKAGISSVTSFNWRHRYMNAAQNTFEDSLEGIVEANETYFRESKKGEKHLNRPARKRGTKVTTPGIYNSDWVAVLTAIDRNHHEYDHVLQQVTSDEIEMYLGAKIMDESILCTDSKPAYNHICRNHHLHHIVLKNTQTQNGIFHIQNINNYHAQLKQWYLKMKGVASKYLPKYLGWFRMLAWHKYQDFSDDNLTEQEKLFEFKLLQIQQHNF